MLSDQVGNAIWGNNYIFYDQISNINASIALVYPSSIVLAAINQSLTDTVILAIVVIAIISLLIFLISVSIARPLNTLSSISIKIKDKDLSAEMKNSINRSDEIGNIWSSTYEGRNELTQLITSNKKISEQLATAAEELSSSSEEIPSSSENIASSQQQISKGASNQVVAITETQKKFSELTQGIRQIREKVDNINQISDLIRNISNQTNMLALNAAIEALVLEMLEKDSMWWQIKSGN